MAHAMFIPIRKPLLNKNCFFIRGLVGKPEETEKYGGGSGIFDKRRDAFEKEYFYRRV